MRCARRSFRTRRSSSSTTRRPTGPGRSSPTKLAGRIDQVLRHERNRGKGAALRTGFAAATGDVVLVQDADLEYDPREYPKLFEADLREQGRRGVRLALRRRRVAPRALFLARGAEQAAHAGLERADRPEPHRHGSLLQGVPPRGARSGSSSRRTASASSPRSPRRWRSWACGSTRSACPTPAAPTPKARRSAGATACTRSGACSSTTCSASPA